uniref:Uncharacterized protein n=1 Tax=Siphoviridae sp. ctrpg19 TaxID=2826481 RepID=A0A8S5MKE5_9CAUD|nr:MAG TPA: hypothetical protein [Siphoviridae sp. ctrpg19]
MLNPVPSLIQFHLIFVVLYSLHPNQLLWMPIVFCFRFLPYFILHTIC